MILTLIITLVILLFSWRTVMEQRKALTLSRQNWDDLIHKLRPASTETVSIALEFLNPGQTSIQTNPRDRLASVGGLEGIRQMRTNGDLILALAAQAERSHPGETRTLVRLMRRDGATLRRAAFWLTLRVFTDKDIVGASCIQHASAAYYRMTFRLLEAVRENAPNDLPPLNEALWS